MPQQKRSPVHGKTITLGVSGGIAAYKSCDIVRLLKVRGAQVHVMLTKAAKEFVAPLTLQALSQNTIHTDIFDLTQESLMSHIQLADDSQLILLAPATADLLGKIAHGLCDDLVTTVVCATRAPVVFAPAMNVHMWENPLVQENVLKLKNHSYGFVGPAQGSLACGYEGMGRMEEPLAIIEAVETAIARRKK